LRLPVRRRGRYRRQMQCDECSQKEHALNSTVRFRHACREEQTCSYAAGPLAVTQRTPPPGARSSLGKMIAICNASVIRAKVLLVRRFWPKVP
jgi:hypothetical protein